VLPRTRVVSAPAVLTGAIRSLLAGPTAAERRLGYGGWFSRSTAGMLRSARISGGVAYLDFRNFSRLIPNASTSCGSTLLLAQLDRTATQFATVDRAVYSFDGSSSSFYEWLQREPPSGAAEVIALDAKANGKTVRAHVGDRIVLTLEANASTGYAWSAVSSGAPVLRLDSARYVPGSKPGLVGAPGRYVARFTVRAAGRARIELVYERHTQPKTPPAARFAVTIVSTRR
jgi:predicted secreted protein